MTGGPKDTITGQPSPRVRDAGRQSRDHPGHSPAPTDTRTTAFPALVRSGSGRRPGAWSGGNGQGPRAPGHRVPQPCTRERTTSASRQPETPADANPSQSGWTVTRRLPAHRHPAWPADRGQPAHGSAAATITGQVEREPRSDPQRAATASHKQRRATAPGVHVLTQTSGSRANCVVDGNVELR